MRREVAQELLQIKEKYGDERSAAMSQQLGLARLFLHARLLLIALPKIGKLELRADLDPDLELILDKLRN